MQFRHTGFLFERSSVALILLQRRCTMKITNVDILIVEDANPLLKAICEITIDKEFVVHDLKVIQGPQGLFVAMPNRCAMKKCRSCGRKIDVDVRFCSFCGAQCEEPDIVSTTNKDDRRYFDIVHPINAACRAEVEKAILTVYEERLSCPA